MSIEYDVSFDRLVLRLSIPDHAGQLLAFLRAYFEPFFRFDAVDPAASPRWNMLVADGAPPPETPAGSSPTIDIDRSGGFLRCTGTVVDSRRIVMSPFGVTAEVDRQAHVVRLSGASTASLRVPTLRVIEDLFVHELERGGSVFLHASAAVAQGGAVLICGNKKAGKTSGLCKLLRVFETEKMANDNCVLRVQDGRVVARGWPAFFKIELGTVALHAELGRDFPPAARALLADSDALWKVYEKVPLYPRQGAERFGAALNVEAPVAAIIFARFDAARAPGLSRIGIADAGESILDYVQGSRHPNHPDWMELEALTDRQHRAHVAEIVAALGPAELYALRWAPSFEDLLSRIPALRPSHRGIRACMADAAADDAWPPLPIAEMPHVFTTDGAS